MPSFELTTLQLLLAAAAFVLVISLWMIVVVALSMRRVGQEKAIARRLGEFEADDDDVRVLRLWHEGQEASTVVPTGSAWARTADALRRFPEDAGWAAPAPSILMGVAGVAALIAAVVFAATGAALPAIGAAVAVVVIFTIYARYRIAKRLAVFERQFADALQLLARSLRAGHPLTGAFRLTADEMRPPVSHIFDRICQEQSLGIDLETSLRNAGDQSGSADLKLFVTSVSIQLRTGGNLADMMDRLAEVIRDRIRLSQRIRIVSAQTQLSKRILLGLPLFMLLLLSIVNPAHLEPLFVQPLGHKMLLAAGAAMLLGWYTMNRMARLRY